MQGEPRKKPIGRFISGCLELESKYKRIFRIVATLAVIGSGYAAVHFPGIVGLICAVVFWAIVVLIASVYYLETATPPKTFWYGFSAAIALAAFAFSTAYLATPHTLFAPPASFSATAPFSKWSEGNYDTAPGWFLYVRDAKVVVPVNLAVFVRLFNGDNHTWITKWEARVFTEWRVGAAHNHVWRRRSGRLPILSNEGHGWIWERLAVADRYGPWNQDPRSILGPTLLLKAGLSSHTLRATRWSVR